MIVYGKAKKKARSQAARSVEGSAQLGVTTSRATSGDRKNDPNTNGQQ